MIHIIDSKICDIVNDILNNGAKNEQLKELDSLFAKYYLEYEGYRDCIQFINEHRKLTNEPSKLLNFDSLLEIIEKFDNQKGDNWNIHSFKEFTYRLFQLNWDIDTIVEILNLNFKNYTPEKGLYCSYYSFDPIERAEIKKNIRKLNNETKNTIVDRKVFIENIESLVYGLLQTVYDPEINGSEKLTINTVGKWIENKKKELSQSEQTAIAPIEPEPIQQPQMVKIQWTENKKILTDIFRQLKTIVNKNNTPVITNSNIEIANFLKQNFDCFENVTVSTIDGMLKNDIAENNTPKFRRIIIERDKSE